MTEHNRSGDMCLHDPALVNRHEAMLATLTQTLNDFIKRSTEDRFECASRYERDREEALSWRNEMRSRMEIMDKFIEGLKPDHKMLMILAMGIIVGSLTLVWRMIWTNITIGKVAG
jgi:hypothetical protein